MKVGKSLSPEEKSVLANVRSLLDQLEQMEQTEPVEGMPVEEEPVMMAANTDGLPAGDEEVTDLEEEKIIKAEFANEDADDRIDELPVDDEEALKVLKAIMSLGQKKTVNKSARPQTDDVQIRTLKILKSLADRIEQQGNAIVGILEGMGVADQVISVQKSRRPVNPPQGSAEDAIRALVAAVGGKVEKSADVEPVGTLKDVLKGLYQQ